MATKNAKKANEFLRELEERRRKYQDRTGRVIPGLFKENRQDRKPPGNFHDSSFLFIRSYDGDAGARPFSGIPFWNSPDIRLAPVTDLAAYTRTLDAGQTYQISCTVRNAGDLAVPSAKVEFFLTDPSIGFDTRFATKLGVAAGWVNSLSSTQVNLLYPVPPSEGGHKCLFARVFSFSPLDIPIDDYQLHPTLDRHVAQLNLNIVPQATAFSFNWVHLPTANDTIAWRVMAAEEVMALRHPVLADIRIPEQIKEMDARLQKMILRPVDREQEPLRFTRRGNQVSLTTKGEQGPDAGRQREIGKAMQAALKQISAGRANSSRFRELFTAYRQMNREVRQHTFEMLLPHLGLEPGEAIGLELMGADRNMGIQRGGITLLITG